MEYKVLGSFSNRLGDGVLVSTQGVTGSADTFLSTFVGRGTDASSEYSTIIFFLNCNTYRYSIVHYQDGYTAFPRDSRYYATRILYELTYQEFADIDYSFVRLLGELDLMHPYTLGSVGSESPSRKESFDVPPKSLVDNLKKALVMGVMTGKPLYVRLGEDDKLFGEKVLTSSKLRAILTMVSQLSPNLRKYVSVGYSMENNSPGVRAVASYLSIVAYFDTLEAWGMTEESVVSVDWSGDEIRIADPNNEMQLCEKLFEGLSVQPKFVCVPDFTTLAGTYRSSLDRFKQQIKITNEKLDSEQLRQINAMYDQLPDDSPIRNQSAKCLAWQYLMGCNADDKFINSFLYDDLPQKYETAWFNLKHVKNWAEKKGIIPDVINYLLKPVDSFDEVKSLFNNSTGWDALTDELKKKCEYKKYYLLIADKPDESDSFAKAMNKMFDKKFSDCKDKRDFMVSAIKSRSNSNNACFFGKGVEDYIGKPEDWKEFSNRVCSFNSVSLPEDFKKGDLTETAFDFVVQQYYERELHDVMCEYVIPQQKDVLIRKLPRGYLLNNKEIDAFLKVKNEDYCSLFRPLCLTLDSVDDGLLCHYWFLRLLNHNSEGDPCRPMKDCDLDSLLQIMLDNENISDYCSCFREVAKENVFYDRIAKPKKRSDIQSNALVKYWKDRLNEKDTNDPKPAVPLKYCNFESLLKEEDLKANSPYAERLYAELKKDKKHRLKLVGTLYNLYKNNDSENAAEQGDALGKFSDQYSYVSKRDIKRVAGTKSISGDKNIVQRIFAKVVDFFHRELFGLSPMGKRIALGTCVLLLGGVVVYSLWTWIDPTTEQNQLEEWSDQPVCDSVDACVERILYVSMPINGDQYDTLVPLGSIHIMHLLASRYLDTMFDKKVKPDTIKIRVDGGLFDTVFPIRDFQKVGFWKPLLDYYNRLLTSLNENNNHNPYEDRQRNGMDGDQNSIIFTFSKCGQMRLSSGQSLLNQILSSDTHCAESVVDSVSINDTTFIIDNKQFLDRNKQHERTLDRTEYYFWLILQLDSIMDSHHYSLNIY